MTDDDKLVPAKEIRKWAGNITPMTEWRWVRKGILPEPIVINGRKYYPESVKQKLKGGAQAVA